MSVVTPIALSSGSNPSLLSSDSPSATAAYPPQWGIFSQNGQPLIAVADIALSVESVAAIQYSRDYQISDYPQEQGAFASYNKVQLPSQSKITFIVSESREPFLNLIEDAVASLELVVIVTPEVQYESANLIHYSYLRDGRSGVTMLKIEVWAQEVRVTAGQQISGLASQPEPTGGTARPVGQASVNPGQHGASGSWGNPEQRGASGSWGYTGTTGSWTTGATNAAYPNASGNVQTQPATTPQQVPTSPGGPGTGASGSF